jgi:hypothetical protein
MPTGKWWRGDWLGLRLAPAKVAMDSYIESSCRVLNDAPSGNTVRVQNHVGEMLFILISPKPLPAPVGQPALDIATVAQWERQCSGHIERRESSGGAGRQWTKEEQAAEEGTRKLAQSDPLTQTIYRVRVKQGGCALVPIPLRIAP